MTETEPVLSSARAGESGGSDVERGGRRKGLGPPDGERKSPDLLSRAISVAAFLISVASFALQYSAREQFLYVASATRVHRPSDPTRLVLQTNLVLYNLGNRVGALLDANAALFDLAFEAVKDNPTEACRSAQNPVRLPAVGATLPDGLGQYAGVVEAGKILSRDLQFSLPDVSETRSAPQGGLVCLYPHISDSRGYVEPLHKPLAYLRVVTENGRVVRYEPLWTSEPEHFDVYNKFYFPLPF